jgi:hypothetical protein
MVTHALRFGLAAAVMLAGWSSVARSSPPSTIDPVSAPVPAVEAAAPAGEPAASAAEALPAVARLAVVQSAAPVQLAFKDAQLGDLHAPRQVLGERVRQGLDYGSMPGRIFLQPGTTGQAAAGGAILALFGGAIGAVTGLIVGGVEDAVNQANIPLEKIFLHKPGLQAGGNDLALGPRALRDCTAERLGAAATLVQTQVADAEEDANFTLLRQQGFSHALTLDEIGLAFEREPGDDTGEDRHERFAVAVVVHYRVHELGESTRVAYQGSAQERSPPLRLDRWAAEHAREVRELAARGCGLLADRIGIDLYLRFALATN